MVAGPPTNLSAEMISPTTISVSWQPPSDGSTVVTYLLSYIDQNETVTKTLPPFFTTFTFHTNCEDINITLQALSQHIPSVPVTTEFILRKLDQSPLIHSHRFQTVVIFFCVKGI